MKRIHKLSSLFLLVLLLPFTRISSGVAQESRCPNPVCVYFPVLFTTSPVTIAEERIGGFIPVGFRVFGEVKNASARPVYDVLLEAKFFNRSNQLLRAKTVSTALPMIPPGENIPFDITSGILPPEVARYELQLVGWSWEGSVNYQSLTVTSLQTVFDIGTPSGTTTVKVRNDGPAPLKDVRGVAWSLDSSSIIQSYLIAEILCPGAEISFEIFFKMLPVYDPNSVKAAAQGTRITALQGASDCPASP